MNKAYIILLLILMSVGCTNQTKDVLVLDLAKQEIEISAQRTLEIKSIALKEGMLDSCKLIVSLRGDYYISDLDKGVLKEKNRAWLQELIDQERDAKNRCFWIEDIKVKGDSAMKQEKKGVKVKIV